MLSNSSHGNNTTENTVNFANNCAGKLQVINLSIMFVAKSNPKKKINPTMNQATPGKFFTSLF